MYKGVAPRHRTPSCIPSPLPIHKSISTTDSTIRTGVYSCSRSHFQTLYQSPAAKQHGRPYLLYDIPSPQKGMWLTHSRFDSCSLGDVGRSRLVLVPAAFQPLTLAQSCQLLPVLRRNCCWLCGLCGLTTSQAFFQNFIPTLMEDDG